MNNIDMLTVYLGSSGKARPVFQEAAKELGTLIGKSGKKLVYGGMDAGLMGILAQSAMESNAHVTGIIPQKIQDSERVMDELSETIMVEELCDRKKKMFLMADAVLALPGGFGTLDESLEVLYWGNLGLHDKPLILINIESYWDPLISYLKTLSDFNDRFLIVVDTVEDVMPALENWEALPPVSEPLHFPHFEDEITRGTDESIVIDKASVENTYFAICALGLKQLGKHRRAIGFLNMDGQFDGLLEWIHRAAEESFVTQKCLKLFAAHENKELLSAILANQDPVTIDLHSEKWGERRKKPRDI